MEERGGGMKQILLVTGACRSGKSRFAQGWAEARSPRRLFLATAVAGDQEMAERIRRHREGRGPGWETVEEPRDVAHALRARGREFGVVLMDCATLWATNLLLDGLACEEILARTVELAEVLGEVPCSVALVTNEVGWGIVPANDLARRFRDVAGAMNQALAQAADQVVLLVCGIPLTLKG
ncbi:MAG: bifunctional adenosylcobinamide kinase/adenosylcobinamide-phosphate guanylyltransferase [bacterium]